MKTKALAGKKVCILHPRNPHLDFRLKKTIKMLADSGADVYLLAYLSQSINDSQDWGSCTSLCGPRPYTTIKASGNKNRFLRILWNLTVLRIQLMLEKKSGCCDGLANIATELDVDWYHCINVDGAEEFIKLAKKTKRPLVYESYEYFPDDLKKGTYPFSKNNKRLYKMEKKLVSKVAAATIVVGEEIAQGYQDHYGGPRPVVIHNIAEKIVSEIKPTRNVVRFYFQSYLRPTYNIENLIDAFSQTAGPATLTIQGNTFDEAYRLHLTKRIEMADRASDIYLLEACEHNRVVEVAHGYDVGIISVSAETSNGINKGISLALPNKLFTYASAGLALAIFNYPAQSRILGGFNAVRTFSPGSEAEMAAALQFFIDNKGEINDMKKESLRFANSYSFRDEAMKFVATCAKAVGNKNENIKKGDRSLHVLHLPLNIRWILDATIKGQEELGIGVEKMLFSSSGVDHPELERIYTIPKRNPNSMLKGVPSYLVQSASHFIKYLRLLFWADVVHWQYARLAWMRQGIFKDADFWLLQFLNKPVIAQFHGMDFRNNPEWMKTNPWWHESFDPEEMQYFTDLAATTQKEFGDAGIHFGLSFGMMPYVEPKYKLNAHIMERAVDIAQIEKRTDYSERDKVVIVHGPSVPQRKGTPYVLAAMEEIKKIRNVEFKLLADMDHDEVLKEMRGADIAIDQLICGDYGVFAVEAMASGAAVVANICDQLLGEYPSDLPIANANPQTIKDVILRLIDNRDERVAAGKAGPSYAYKVHSIEETAPEILRVYRKVAVAKGKKETVKRIDYHLALCEKKGWKGISHG